MSYGLVYLITNLVNGKVYVGQTTLSLKARWNSHLSDWEKSKYPLYHAFTKYGIVNFSIQLICEALNNEELDFLEILFIAVFRAQEEEFGYNIKDGGSHGKHVQSTKDKISRKNKGKPGHNKGGTCPEHVKEAIRKANTGRVKSLEERQHHSAVTKGKSTKAWGHKVSATLRARGIKPKGYNQPKSLEVRKRMSEACFKRATPIYRLKCSQMNTFRSLVKGGFYGS